MSTAPADNAAALAFLRWVSPAGPWALTAIAPDRSSIETQTFERSTEAALQAWLETNNGRRNLYYALIGFRDHTKRSTTLFSWAVTKASGKMLCWNP